MLGSVDDPKVVVSKMMECLDSKKSWLPLFMKIGNHFIDSIHFSLCPSRNAAAKRADVAPEPERRRPEDYWDS